MRKDEPVRPLVVHEHAAERGRLSSVLYLLAFAAVIGLVAALLFGVG